MAQVNILSIDGGGIRGIIPAMILAELEDRLPMPIAERFHLIAGTSTGGILALGLTKPDARGRPQYAARDLVALYEREGARIFSRSVWHRLHAVGNIAEEKYPSEGIEQVLDEYFGEARLKDVVTDVLITSYEIERRIPWFFKSRKAKVNDEYDFPMKVVARATSAAPTYFEPLKVETSDRSDYYALIDGGVFANNPALCGFVEAKTMFPQAEDILLVSLGTGQLTRRIPYDEARGWGLARWAQPLLNVVFHGVSATVDYHLRHLLPPASDGTKRYYWFQPRLDEGNDDLDDASRTNIRVLKLLAEAIVREHTDDLENLCQQLAQSA
ncbi:MAG: patatin [Acidobacteria bacterium]|nr:MAG: patatin [Acidobacteriota bacterium]